MNTGSPLLSLEHLQVEYHAGHRQKIQAVSDVSFSIGRGETLGLVGESGCGKSSVARAVMQLPKPTAGRVLFRGRDLTRLSPKELREARPRFQMVFQDSLAALNPRRSVGRTIAMPLKVMGERDKSRREKLAREMMDRVGLDPALFHCRPQAFSGGQCQRIQIARTLMTSPTLLVCDEPVSALDVSIQAQILTLLEEIRRQYGLTMLFISHDLAVVKNVSDRVAVMYLGKICEIAPSQRLFQTPAHPYTFALLSAIPEPDPGKPPKKIEMIPGDIPSFVNPPSGCRFRTRCPKAQDICRSREPVLKRISPRQHAACHFAYQR